jgi:AraC-like DNA-binding protein
LYFASFFSYVANFVMNRPPNDPENFPCGASIVQRIMVVNRYDRDADFTYAGSSYPGHLLHLTVEGEVHEEVGGRVLRQRPGDLIWYHENELASGRVLIAPWVIYSVNFLAPSLPPPPFEQRLRSGMLHLRPFFTSLMEVWYDLSVPPAVREMRVQSGLLSLLSQITDYPTQAADKAGELWWTLETAIRRDMSIPADLKRLAALCDKSPATIARSCRRAVGVSPMKRLRQVRMALARGLVRQSELSISEIAQRLGYKRVHEFSREYHHFFAKPPTTDRHHPAK